MRFHFYKQLNAMDCGPTCLRMISRYYGKHYSLESLRSLSGFNKQGVSLFAISETAEKIGFRTRGVRITYQMLLTIKTPCILHVNQNHFVVLISFRGNEGKRGVRIADPAKGIIICSRDEFIKQWVSSKNLESSPTGVALLLEPQPQFYEQHGEGEVKLNWGIVIQYLKQSKWQITQVFIALGITSALQLVIPFLTKSMVDVGIDAQNLQYVTVVLIAQLVLVFSRSIVDFIRGRLLLRISNILTISILSDFWIKLTRLPVSYFDARHTGDTLQRIGDHKQIQGFLTGSMLTTLFSVFNFFVYSIVLVAFSAQIFFVFAVGSILYFIWILFFLRIRRSINYENFHVSAKENSATIQLIQGMQEIRLHNAEKAKRWEWENLQARIFKLNFKSLNYGQIQQAGALLINQGKDLTVTFLVAKLVLEGQLTLGTMLAVQYIIGQLSNPVEQFVGFAQSAQDAKISMERLNEIHQLADEEPAGKIYTPQMPVQKSIIIKSLSFNYPGTEGDTPVLDNITLKIPEGKVTAIVGMSGSGKTTLLKLLLKFYEQYSGEIKVGETNFKHISPSMWRRSCGAVLQDGYIFNDTIAANIAVGNENVDYDRLVDCCEIANILSFIDSRPNGFYTQIGAEGAGLSQGQRQRILIARAIYKNPQYLFFDEATNALDANNEKAIVDNLRSFFAGRTVVVVAHRLSTVKDADKIVVLHKGKIIEEGTHMSLAAEKGHYFELVRNQLELGGV
jgi:ATP-binding cassette subfamily B protein